MPEKQDCWLAIDGERQPFGSQEHIEKRLRRSMTVEQAEAAKQWRTDGMWYSVPTRHAAQL
jgi:hypothetical protein